MVGLVTLWSLRHFQKWRRGIISTLNVPQHGIYIWMQLHGGKGKTVCFPAKSVGWETDSTLISDCCLCYPFQRENFFHLWFVYILNKSTEVVVGRLILFYLWAEPGKLFSLQSFKKSLMEGNWTLFVDNLKISPQMSISFVLDNHDQDEKICLQSLYWAIAKWLLDQSSPWTLEMLNYPFSWRAEHVSSGHLRCVTPSCFPCTVLTAQ